MGITFVHNAVIQIVELQALQVKNVGKCMIEKT